MPGPFNPKSSDVGSLDLDITLRDAAVDETNRPTRRMLANACVGVDAFDAYYATLELFDALQSVHEGIAGGKAKLARILSTHCDDFQRCLYYSLAGRGVIQMLSDLEWLFSMLRARTEISAALLRSGGAVRSGNPPYVSAEPDGPVVSGDTDFELGASWFLDPALGGRLEH